MAAESSAVISAVGKLQSQGRRRMANRTINGPPAPTASSKPKAPPATQKKVTATSPLVLLDEAADGGDLGHALHAREPVAERPVLEGAQIGERVRAAPVDERVLVHPADAGRVGARERDQQDDQEAVPRAVLDDAVDHDATRSVKRSRSGGFPGRSICTTSDQGPPMAKRAAPS